jgi:hypothetical protein
VSPDGRVITIAGGGATGVSGDGGPAVDAGFSAPYALALDGAGNLFVSDAGKLIRKIDLRGE